MIRKILLTGDRGYLGSVLKQRLKEARYEVFGFDIKTNPEQDIRNPTFLERYAFVDCVIHLAGIVGAPNCDINILCSYNTNVVGTKNVINFCKNHNLPLVFASTCSIYGKSDSDSISEADTPNPLELYALTKKLNEEDIRRELDNYLILRFGTLFGQTLDDKAMRYDLVINGMTKTAVEKRKITVFGGRQRRPFISLEEVSRAIITLLKLFDNGKQKEIYNAVAFNKTILDVGKEISQIIGCSLEIEERITDERDYSVSNERLRKIIEPRDTFNEEVKKMADRLVVKTRDKFLPFSLPLIQDEEINEVIDTLKSNWLTMGPKTAEFEKQLADYLNVKHVISVNSCTAALHLSLIALGIKNGDEVITTPYTFASTGNVICHVGAKPVFVDIEKDTFNIDPEKIEKAITEKTKVIIVVHYAGQAADMDKISRIANKYNLKIIEDAAHAIGSEYNGRKIGTSGNLVCFSFYPIKNMTTGEGGAIATNDDLLADRLKKLRLHGISKDAWKRYGKEGTWYYEIEECGWKYNMTDIQAALGLHQLKKLDAFIKKRQEIAEIYDRELGRIENIRIPFKKENIKHSYHLYPILVNGCERNKFIEELEKKKIGTSVHFIPLHLHPFYQKTYGYKKGDFPVAEQIYERIISLPIYPKMDEKDVRDVINAVKDIFKN